MPSGRARCRFFGPKRVNAPGVAFEDLPPIDAVLVTHNHYDHLDLETLARLHERDKPRMIMPLGQRHDRQGPHPRCADRSA